MASTKPLINYSGSIDELRETMAAWKASGIAYCTVQDVAQTFGMTNDDAMDLIREAMATGKIYMEMVGDEVKYRRATPKEVIAFRQYRGDPASAPPEVVVAVMRKLSAITEDSISAVLEQVAQRYESEAK